MATFYEFFCGGGMARAGLGEHWNCLFANDFDEKKANSYIVNWGNTDLQIGDVRDVYTNQLKGNADLLWASFPCQDLSLAGHGLGLSGERSSTISEVWRLIDGLCKEGRGPKIIAFENVCGLITSRGGRDFRTIIAAFNERGYRVGAIVVDALNFLPQSRKRVFLIGINSRIETPKILFSSEAPVGTPRNLRSAYQSLNQSCKLNWIWWKLPLPSKSVENFVNLLEKDDNVTWHNGARTARLLAQMNDLNLSKIKRASFSTEPIFGTVYRRTRVENGIKIVRAEVRFDGVAGCIRTPNGGSSKQILVKVFGDLISSRHLTGRECARLMGLTDEYIIPKNHNEAIYLSGDGVAVPVVSYLSEKIFLPLLDAQMKILPPSNRTELSYA